ncbi:MAG TPA: alpha/beta hydrolase [Anaerolineales bacterium]|nr:alpha/beta hydrolase [Anaerolineales bacterium]
MDQSPHKSGFANVNGIHLHYLDWGGDGPALLFLPGLGCNAHIFDEFAPRFTDRFHVMALTRRGHGESDHPETGYDIDILTEDLKQFLDTLEIDKVILTGHSMAHIELSHFAALYPDRVRKLVFLDAAYDRTAASYKNMLEKHPLRRMQPPGQNDDYYSAEDYFASIKRGYPSLAAIWGELMQVQALHEIKQTPEGKIVDKMSAAIGQALNNTMTSYVPEDSKIRAPTLSVYAISNGCYYISDDWMTEEQKAQVREFFETINYSWVRENIEQFQRNVPQAKIVVIPEGHHYCFIRKEELVFNEMSTFLLEC